LAKDKDKDKDKKKKRSVFFIFIKVLSIIFAFFIILIPLLLGVVIYFNSPVEGTNYVLMENDAISQSPDGSFLVEVRRGETSQSVGLRLERTGLIKNRYFWNLICRLNKEHIKTGTYRIEMPLNQIAIHSILVSGREVLHKVTIPEGVTLKRAARIIEDSGICSMEDFLIAARDPQIIRQYQIQNQTMEGYLFPDTYLFPRDYPAERIVRTMADNFFSNLKIIYPEFEKMTPREINEKVILASIVEREYRIADEAPVMAGVFLNRIRINMALQSCATVEYIITEIQGKPHPRVLLYQDLEIINPYNTYLYRGYPPGPISAPGIIALRAVFFPQRTDFLYFRLENAASGRHYFSRTHDEHIRAGQLITKPSWP